MSLGNRMIAGELRRCAEYYDVDCWQTLFDRPLFAKPDWDGTLVSAGLIMAFGEKALDWCVGSPREAILFFLFAAHYCDDY